MAQGEQVLLIVISKAALCATAAQVGLTEPQEIPAGIGLPGAHNCTGPSSTAKAQHNTEVCASPA